MKHIWKYISTVALATLALAACKPDYPELVPSGVPSASDFDVVISVDQATNMATFTLNNKGMVPVWNFGSEMIDGKASKVYAYTGNGLTLRFREAGEHQVEVKAYNVNGLSTGSVLKTFKMDNTYRDPFDADPYVRAISGGSEQSWVWNSTEFGHLGCGPVGDPLGWWQCDAGGKEGLLYDDVMTFTSDGKYTYDPVDGQAYAKKDAEYPAGHAQLDDDYLFPAEKKTSGYSFENNWNDAGIEEIYLVLDPGSILSYVVHKSLVDNPRYQVLETKTSAMKKKLQLMATASTPANADGISFYYEFVPQGSVAGKDDPLFGKESKTWVYDNETQGYMGCGSSFAAATEWWSAVPHDKDAWGVTDDELTFFADGRYVFDPGADGKVYVNKDSGYHAELYSGDGNDYDAPAERQESTYVLDEDDTAPYIELPAGILFGYVPNAAVLDDQPNRLHIKEMTSERLVLVAVYEGISWQIILRPKEGQGGGGEEGPAELEDVLPGSWTWDPDVAGHFGCGPDLGNPLGWWTGEAHCKDNASMYDDVMTFTADGKYTLDPVDGMTYINKDVTRFEDRKVDSPYGDDFRIRTDKTTVSFEIDEIGDFQVIKLGDGAIFSYVPNNDFVDEPYLYVKECTANKLVLMSFTATGNNGGSIAWQYILKRVK
ncbi:MAG: hypothetical protein J6X71_04890 [Bacteroidales bacterium]|nr:hypothetical protein [Bacteroidales bacterium]